MYIIFLATFLIISLIYLIIFILMLNYSPISSDGLGYYVWLPQTFIFHDYSLSFLNNILPPDLIDQLCAQGFIKYGPGSAYLISPFFFLAHFITEHINSQMANGYTFYYKFFICIGAIFYWLIGITLNYSILKDNTSKKNAVISCFAITYGAGLFLYTICYSSFSHVYSFFAISLFIYLIIKFKGVLLANNKTSLKSFLIGLTLGLIAAIKNANILIFIVYILYGVVDFNSFKKRIIEFFKPKNLIPFALGLLIPLMPLFCYWYYKTGHFIINSYHPEYYINIDVSKSEPSLNTFDFLHPNILAAMFSFKKGLFVYYPVLIFSIFGLFSIKKYFKEFKLAVPVFLFTAIYILSSFKYWWTGHSFGLRFYIDYLAIFAILIASFMESISNSKIKYIIAYIAIIFLTVISIAAGCLVFLGFGNEIGSLI